MSARIRIFAIDDEEDLTDLLHYQLGREGYEVKFANNPFEALGKGQGFYARLDIARCHDAGPGRLSGLTDDSFG